uniref:Structural maintenance of chromosomes protein 3 n=1 Tax=Plectus sambesii TaxID=2011161 RepID=A0A914V280_9BILA
MFIKEVNITGFRSYREATIVDHFSPKHNVIVGRNGSGKSNFFFAIQFVLSDEFSHLRLEQRQGLLHEGTGPRVMSAKVEIVFDNTDNRIPSEANEVRLVRQIGAKKDQYFLDGKTITRSDVVNLMESAGFSRSNQYYIVKQGKINELATSPDSYRLKLLREIAGTRVYDERKDESLQILRDTEGKREKIEGLLKYIEDRLKTLEEEKEELKEYQKWDKMKRSLEYTMYDHELRDTRKKLDKLAEQREEISSKQSQCAGELVVAQNTVNRVTAQQRKLDARFKGLKEERETLSAEQTERFQRKTQLELDIKDLKEEVVRERTGRDNAENDLDQLKSDISEKEERLGEVVPRYNNLQQEESKTLTDLRIREQRCKELYAKQGHKDQFRNEEERDKWLNKEIRFFERQLGETRDQIDGLARELATEEASDNDAKSKAVEMQQAIQENTKKMDDCSAAHSKLKKEREEMNAHRQDLYRQEQTAQQNINAVNEELYQNDCRIRELSSKPLMKGYDSVHRVLDHFRNNNDDGRHNAVLDGYHGCMIENFTCDNIYFQAVEVTAGNRLFYHVVATDRIATKLLKEINNQRLPGEVNFMPLNRISERERRYPENPDVRPMIQVIKYEPEMANVMRQVYGRTLIVRNMETGTKLAKAENIDCVTLEGDQIGRRGTLTGGYQDVKRSRLELQQHRLQMEEQKAELNEKLAEIRRQLTQVEGRVQAKTTEYNELDAQLNQAKFTHQQITERKRDEAQRINQNARNREPKKAQLLQLESRLREIEARKENYQKQLNTPLLSQLSAEEQDEVAAIQTEIKELKKKLDRVTKERATLEVEKNKLDNQLQTNLLRKRESLQAKIQDITIEEKRHTLETQQSELQTVNQRLNEIGKRLAEVEEDCTEYDEEKEKLMRELEDVQEQQKDLETQVSEFSKQSDAIVTKQSILLAKREESMKKVRELGSLPADAFDKFQNLSLKQLGKKLNECLNELKKYENVNKKALDQFVSASEQKEDLTKRKDEQDRNHKAIMDLINVLDHRKYEAIQLTFKQVSKNFEDVFKKLVPDGHARLIMQTGDG